MDLAAVLRARVPLPNSGSSVGSSFIFATTFVPVVGLQRFDRLQVVQHRRVDAGLRPSSASRPCAAWRSAWRPRARLVVQVPVERLGQQQALRLVETERVHVGQEHEQPGELLAALHDAELGALLDRVDRVGAGVGQADDLAPSTPAPAAGTTRSPAPGTDGAPCPATLPPFLRDHRFGVALERVAERIVGGQEEPGVAAGLARSRCRCRWRATRCRRSSAPCSACTPCRTGRRWRRWKRVAPCSSAS